MIQTLNNFLSPLEKLVKKYQKYIGYFFLLLAFLSLGLIFSPQMVKYTGENSLNILWFLLFLPFFARVLNLNLGKALMPLRKEVGILMGTLAFVHGAAYIIPDYTYLLELDFWWQDGFVSYLAFGFFALILTIPLTLTSNKWAMQKLGKYWKTIHRLVYIIIILAITHVVLLKWYREFEFGQVMLLGLYFVGKIIEWKWIVLGKEKTKTYPKGQKWLCVPCGYIYDPLIWDEDSGISAGTEFTDLPDSWSCPECGVKKWDFVPYDEDQKIETEYDAKIIEKTFLNPTTLELVIEIIDPLASNPGQFMTFVWQDAEWEFTRSYSIAKQDGRQFTFLIKLSGNGRGARILQDIELDAIIRIRGIFGHFLLQKTEKPKIFIATGTGLAPIYNMILSLDSGIEKTLYFSVATEVELFYIEKLQNIQSLELHMHTTREEVEWYEFGRVNVDGIEASSGTEWYLCGNPNMVAEAREKLTKRGFEKVYSEEF